MSAPMTTHPGESPMPTGFFARYGEYDDWAGEVFCRKRSRLRSGFLILPVDD